ncbi:hypothetical protein RD110_18695 [Rhodoferax koreense]|uniref:Uncharacterized protein n=2 Tax=Rhodoferax koreensis TaxID=1842727 RepID=A0A1P8JZ05_9BURK|nr:hypothetical protein RD110_18695 [Rhodoferax koreense]
MGDAMPLTAAWINERREEWGRKHVDAMVRAGMQGERNCFYAIEGGYIIGMPFDWSVEVVSAISMGVMSGARYLVALRDPKTGEAVIDAAYPAEVFHGAH